MSLPALLMGEVMTVIGGDVTIVEAGKERQPLFLLLLAWEHSPTVDKVSSSGNKNMMVLLLLLNMMVHL